MSEQKKTIKERIKDIQDKYNIDSPTFSSEIMDLVERGAYPKNFCPDCQERMTYDPQKGYLLCINCGFEDIKPTPSMIMDPVTKEIYNSTSKKGKEIEKKLSTIPEGVQKLLDDVPKEEKETRIPTPRNPGRAEKIAKLKSQMDGGPITEEDSAIIKGQDPNIKEINWS